MNESHMNGANAEWDNTFSDELNTILCSQQQFKMRHWITESHLTKRCDIGRQSCELFHVQRTAAEMTKQVQNKQWIRHSGLTKRDIYQRFSDLLLI